MEPRRLRGGNGYTARALDFPENNDELHLGDGHLSALVEFDEVSEFDRITGKYSLWDLRYTGQMWEVTGPVHVTLLKHLIKSIEE